MQDEQKLKDLYRDVRNSRVELGAGMMDLIREVPATFEWYKNISDLIRWYLGKRIDLRRSVQILDAFDKKFDEFKQQFQDVQATRRTLMKQQQEIDERRSELYQKIVALLRKKDNCYYFFGGLDTQKKGMGRLAELASNDREKQFFKNLQAQINKGIDLLRRGEKAEPIEIKGKPWRLIASKDQKWHFEHAQRYIEDYNKLINNPVPVYTDQDEQELNEYKKEDNKLMETGRSYGNDIKEIDAQENYPWKRYLEDGVFEENEEFNNAIRGRRKDVWNKAKDRLNKERAEGKREAFVESGYNDWSREAKAMAREHDIDVMANKIRRSNSKLSEQELRNLAERLLVERGYMG